MIMSDLKGKIWMDGDLLEWSDAKIHVLTHTLHYGTGVFEGVRAYETSNGSAIFRLQDHTDRLFESARLIGMKITFKIFELNRRRNRAIFSEKAVLQQETTVETYYDNFCNELIAGIDKRNTNLDKTKVVPVEYGDPKCST